jgi:chitinase
MTPEDIDPCLCTHVIYAFSEMENNQLIPTEKHDLKDKQEAGRQSINIESHIDSRSMVYRGFFERFNAWKNVNKNLRTLLAVGGWVRENNIQKQNKKQQRSTVLGYGNERFLR